MVTTVPPERSAVDCDKKMGDPVLATQEQIGRGWGRGKTSTFTTRGRYAKPFNLMLTALLPIAAV